MHAVKARGILNSKKSLNSKSTIIEDLIEESEHETIRPLADSLANISLDDIQLEGDTSNDSM